MAFPYCNMYWSVRNLKLDVLSVSHFLTEFNKEWFRFRCQQYICTRYSAANSYSCYWKDYENQYWLFTTSLVLVWFAIINKNWILKALVTIWDWNVPERWWFFTRDISWHNRLTRFIKLSFSLSMELTKKLFNVNFELLIYNRLKCDKIQSKIVFEQSIFSVWS